MAHLKMLRPVLAFTLILFSVSAICSAQSKGDSKGAGDVVALLEKSGHRYTKVSDGIWEINFTGDNLKDFLSGSR